MSIGHFINLLEICLKITYFQFQDKFLKSGRNCHRVTFTSYSCQLLHGALSHQGHKKTDEQQPRMWKRCDDDTFVVQRTTDRDNFHEHINSIAHAYNSKLKKQEQIGVCPSMIPVCSYTEGASKSPVTFEHTERAL